MPPEENIKSQSGPKRDLTAFYTVGAIIIVIAIVAGVIFFTSSRSAPTQQTQTSATQSVSINNVNTAEEPYVGNPNAPVTLAYWSDYQCPYCKQFETEVLPTLMTQYVDTGEVKIVFKDFQFLGPDSDADGEYARAIWALYPDQYFAWRSAMYTTQPEENSLDAADNLTRVEQVTASIPGIDLTKVETEVADNKTTYDAQMQADQEEGVSFGIQSTPSFIIGNQVIVGAQPLATFTAAINAQLK
jgi:protein-disulfide isomerase